MSYDAMKSRGTLTENTRRQQPDPNAGVHRSATDHAKARAWAVEHLPDENPDFAAQAALRLRRFKRPITPENVRAQMLLDHPWLDETKGES